MKNKPDYHEAQFYLANSYDNLYKPTRKGEAENDGYMNKAIEHYQLAAERDPDPTRSSRCSSWSPPTAPDKLADPAKAEPVVKKMIEMEPNEPTNYFGLSKLYEDAGRYDEAEAGAAEGEGSQAERSARLHDACPATTTARATSRRRSRTSRRRRSSTPKNPQGFHLIATSFEEKVPQGLRLTPAQKKEYALKGIAAEDKALALNPGYVDAMIVKNILMRHQANAEKDPAKQKTAHQGGRRAPAPRRSRFRRARRPPRPPRRSGKSRVGLNGSRAGPRIEKG